MKAEEKIQQEIFMWFWNMCCRPNCNPREIILHIPNEGIGNARLTSVGLYSGAADLFLTYKGQMIWVEVKTDKGIQSPAQVKFEQHIKSNPALGKYFLCRSLEDFKKLIN